MVHDWLRRVNMLQSWADQKPCWRTVPISAARQDQLGQNQARGMLDSGRSCPSTSGCYIGDRILLTTFHVDMEAQNDQRVSLSLSLYLFLSLYCVIYIYVYMYFHMHITVLHTHTYIYIYTHANIDLQSIYKRFMYILKSSYIQTFIHALHTYLAS